jgi:hypothetical protein
MSPRVIVVMLRRPQLSKPHERRDDPFWEFGSFGCTGCHRRNLLNPKRSGELNGTQFAFVQGGDKGLAARTCDTAHHDKVVRDRVRSDVGAPGNATHLCHRANRDRQHRLVGCSASCRVGR